MSTALRSLGLLDVLSSTPAGPSVARLATKPCEKGGLAILRQDLPVPAVVRIQPNAGVQVRFDQAGIGETGIVAYHHGARVVVAFKIFGSLS